eukprot:CAMPEP_0197034598 /NCGR_PEP_ID=MMETSP1384-20130603/12666_1 /TAXON_ID=29189 /ORGANISM="Ammonia sp." /LENGTH=285 /DNA_ID=CAMNT_0042464547 /DNA_START=57 /DNA_END=914 /DNA_ORIENTATION=+
MDQVADPQDINAIKEYIDRNMAHTAQTDGKLDMSRYQQINPKHILLVDGYIRSVQGLIHLYTIPTAVNQICTLFYSSIIRRLQWNDQYYTDTKLTLQDDKYLVVHTADSGYACVSADIEPISQGVHCFRVLSHSNSRNTIFFSFMRWGPDNQYKYDSFYQARLYGTTTHGYVCANGKNAGTGLCNPAVEYQLDLLLDLEKSEIRIGFVKDYWNDAPKNSYESEEQMKRRRKLEIVHEDIPTDWQWLPHFNMYDANSYLRILSIDPELYRQENEETDKLLKVATEQ